MTDENAVYIGDKPIMIYASTATVQLTADNRKEIIIKARGKYISKAVDVSQIVTTRLLKGKAIVGDIKIDSEEFTKEKKIFRVSSIEITLKKQ